MSESTIPRTPPGRYGSVPTARRRRTVVVAGAIGGLLVLALVVWIGAGLLRDPVQFNDVGYSIKGPERVDVTFDVIKAPEATAECTIRALNASFAEVGVVQVTVGPTAAKIERHTVTVATQELAVTGVVKTCAILPDSTR